MYNYLVLQVIAGMDFMLPTKKSHWLFCFPDWTLKPQVNFARIPERSGKVSEGERSAA